MIKKFLDICTSIGCFIIGKILIICGRYDKKYCEGRFFSERFRGIFSTGWKWMVRDWILCKKFKTNLTVPWPIDPRNHVAFPHNIFFHPDDLNNFQGMGVYFQGFGEIHIGRGTYIAPNVGLITANHDFSDLDSHLDPKPIIIGEKCWIGMNSIILPGVTLGANTIVGAGSVVTKSFPEGKCIIAGNPAKVIKNLD